MYYRIMYFPYLSLIVCIVGLLIWALSTSPKLPEMGKIMFGAGMLAWLLTGVKVV